MTYIHLSVCPAQNSPLSSNPIYTTVCLTSSLRYLQEDTFQILPPPKRHLRRAKFLKELPQNHYRPTFRNTGFCHRLSFPFTDHALKYVNLTTWSRVGEQPNARQKNTIHAFWWEMIRRGRKVKNCQEGKSTLSKAWWMCGNRNLSSL